MTSKTGSICYAMSALLALYVAFPSGVRAESADLVLCDRVAADPADPDKPKNVRGVNEIAQADIPLALKFCKSAGGSRRAMYQLGRAYAANRQLSEAIGTYRKAVEKGSTSAMVELGVMYGLGIGTEKNEDMARKLFQRAADAGNPRGITNLAAIGGGNSPDPTKTRAVLTRAAEANSSEAQYQLGMMMANGVGGAQDDVGARAMFEKAAAQDHPAALERAGNFASAGRGGPKDATAAKAYYEKAAALGNEQAKTALKRADCTFVLRSKTGQEFGCF